MHGAEDKDFVVSKYKYLRALALFVTTVFSTFAYSDFAVFTTSESSSLEGVSGRYFGSQARNLLDISRSEIKVVYDPYPIDFEDILSDISKSNSGKSSHLIYLALPTSYTGNELSFSFDGELVSLQEIYSIIEGLQGDYLLVIESGEDFPSQFKFPNVPNNVSIIGVEISSRLQTLYDYYGPPYASDLSILFFQELSRVDTGQKVSVERITARLSRKYEEINTLYFYGGSGSNIMLPSFVPEPKSFYYVISEAETESEARKEKEAQVIREAEAREKREAQALIEKEKAEAREKREAQAKMLKKLKEEQKAAEAKVREEEEAKNTAKAKPQVSEDPDSVEEPDLGEALALIQKMKAEAAERERQLIEANKEAEKKRKNTTSFGF